ncbi:MAG TPA: hypothetical protein PKJ45_00795 [Rubrivivax sp.]|nr:hypothetical protein [Rubrivivax sp.]
MIGERRITGMTLALLLAGCSLFRGAPQEGPAPAPAPRAPIETSAAERFVQQQRLRAEQSEADARWAEAAWSWEVLSALRPDDAAVAARLDAVRLRISRLRAQHAAEALAAEQRRDFDAARRAWLQVLALDPHDETAAPALRELELARSVRSRLGRFVRVPAPSRSVRAPARSNPPATPALEARPEAGNAADRRQ